MDLRITLKDAVRLGICRVRDPSWARKNAYLKIDLIQRRCGENHFDMGPWLHLYERQTQELIGVRTPQDLLFMTFSRDECGWEPYIGEIDPEDKYNVLVYPAPQTKEAG